ncbi:MAG: hypothetical protein GWP91_20030 [Rhodobacterales bacterium]|nr:hypothetical protein [Rhodobacterales bacterium]
MKRALTFIIPFTIVFSIGATIWWMTLPPTFPRGEAVAMEVADVYLEQPFVRLEGVAHYEVVLRQKPQGRLFGDDKTYFLFPFFAKNNESDRAIRVMVRTTRPPERLVNYEHMAIEGYLSLPSEVKVPYSSEITIGKRSDYFFTDEMLLLEPWLIESDGEVWRVEDAEVEE